MHILSKRLGLFVLAYNLGNFLRRFALPGDAIVKAAMGSTYTTMYLTLGLILVGACVFSWYFDYIIRTQIAVLNRYLDEVG